MKTIFKTILLVAVALVSIKAISLKEWKVNTDEVSIKFKINDKKVVGSFSGLEATIKFDAEHLENSSFNAIIDAKSIDTGVKGRDKHLRSDDYFDVEKHPQIKFVSSKIEKKDKGYEVEGMITIRGIEKKVSMPFTFENQTFIGKLKLFQADFLLGKSKKKEGEKPNVLVKISVPVI